MIIRSIKVIKQERLMDYAASQLIRQHIGDQISLCRQLHCISYNHAHFLSGTPEDALSNGPGHRSGPTAETGRLCGLSSGAADAGPAAAGQVEEPHAHPGPPQAPHDRRV